MLSDAKFHEERKVAEKLLVPPVAVVEGFALKLANSGLPMHAASILAARIAQLEQHAEVLNGVCQSWAAICAGLQTRIAALEKPSARKEKS